MMLKQSATLLIKFTLISVAIFAQVNDPCTVQYSGNAGVCKYDKDCPIAVQQVNFGIRPTYCGFVNRDAIVCCEGDVGSSRPNDNSFLSEPSSGSDIVFEPSNRPKPPNRPSRSKTEEHCIEYGRRVSGVIEALPLLPNPDPVAINVTKCDYNSVPLIVGGSPAMASEFPHMAAIGYRVDGEIRYLCGGTLISDEFVLTAAHCIRNRFGTLPVHVRLGDLHLKRDDDGSFPINVNIERTTVHPNYKPPAKYNDIALLKLSQQVRFNKFIRPACLWSKMTFEQTKAVATGWGQIAYSESQSDTLLKVVLNIIDNNICSRHFKPSKHLPNGIQTSMMCAGDLQEEKDTCSGDSGGPIVVTDKNNQCLFHVIGITSFGMGCAVKVPAVYTRVSAFIPWIESEVWP